MVNNNPEKRKETTGEMIRSFIVAILIALVFRSLAYEPFHIPSSSMYSTLYEGDYIFVSKLSYGYSRFSFPFSPKLFEGRILETLPERGDVVVFRNPAHPEVDYIKRVIGLPGETVQVKHGRLFINGTLVEQTRRGDMIDDDSRVGPIKSALYDETLPGGKTHIVLDRHAGNADPDSGFDSDNTSVYKVPEGHYFMMGDNRDNSQDSRFSRALGYPDAPGFVPFENLVGRAEMILVSYDTSIPIWQFWRWPSAFRGDRWVKKIV
ncbi:MAG: signal peptidase I [Rickettsiales bacterium]